MAPLPALVTAQTVLLATFLLAPSAARAARAPRQLQLGPDINAIGARPAADLRASARAPEPYLPPPPPGLAAAAEAPARIAELDDPEEERKQCSHPFHKFLCEMAPRARRPPPPPPAPAPAETQDVPRGIAFPAEAVLNERAYLPPSPHVPPSTTPPPRPYIPASTTRAPRPPSTASPIRQPAEARNIVREYLPPIQVISRSSTPRPFVSPSTTPPPPSPRLYEAPTTHPPRRLPTPPVVAARQPAEARIASRGYLPPPPPRPDASHTSHVAVFNLFGTTHSPRPFTPLIFGSHRFLATPASTPTSLPSTAASQQAFESNPPHLQAAQRKLNSPFRPESDTIVSTTATPFVHSPMTFPPSLPSITPPPPTSVFGFEQQPAETRSSSYDKLPPLPVPAPPQSARPLRPPSSGTQLLTKTHGAPKAHPPPFINAAPSPASSTPAPRQPAEASQSLRAYLPPAIPQTKTTPSPHRPPSTPPSTPAPPPPHPSNTFDPGFGRQSPTAAPPPQQRPATSVAAQPHPAYLTSAGDAAEARQSPGVRVTPPPAPVAAPDRHHDHHHHNHPHHHGRDLCEDPFHSFLCQALKPRKRITGARPPNLPLSAGAAASSVAERRVPDRFPAPDTSQSVWVRPAPLPATAPRPAQADRVPAAGTINRARQPPFAYQYPKPTPSFPDRSPAPDTVNPVRQPPAGYEYPKPNSPFTDRSTAADTVKSVRQPSSGYQHPRLNFPFLDRSPAADTVNPVNQPPSGYQYPKPNPPLPDRSPAADTVNPVKLLSSGYQYPKPTMPFHERSPAADTTREVKEPAPDYQYPKPAIPFPDKSSAADTTRSVKQPAPGYQYPKPAVPFSDKASAADTQRAVKEPAPGYQYPKPSVPYEDKFPAADTIKPAKEPTPGYQYPKTTVPFSDRSASADTSNPVKQPVSGYQYPKPFIPPEKITRAETAISGGYQARQFGQRHRQASTAEDLSFDVVLGAGAESRVAPATVARPNALPKPPPPSQQPSKHLQAPHADAAQGPQLAQLARARAFTVAHEGTTRRAAAEF